MTDNFLYDQNGHKVRIKMDREEFENQEEQEFDDDRDLDEYFPEKRYVTKDVLFEAVEDHPKLTNCRKSLTDISELMDNIREVGLQSPILLWGEVLDEPVERPWGMVSERYYILSGFRRRLAISRLIEEGEPYVKRFEYIPARIFVGSLKEALEANLIENMQRNTPSMLEIGERLRRLQEEYQMTQKELGEIINRSQPWVSVALRLADRDNVSPRLREVAHAGLIKDWAITEIVKKASSLEEQTELVEEIIDLAEDGKPKKKKKKSRSGPKVRSRKVLMETFLDRVEEEGNTPETEAHLSGVLKGLVYALGGEVSWEEMSRSKWGLNDFEYDEE